MEGETKASRRSRRSTKKSVSQSVATTTVSQPGTQPVAEHGVQSDTQVSCKPSAQPILEPGAQPVAQTVTQLSASADTQPSAQPSVQPNAQPDAQAEAKPDAEPDAQPGVQPDVQRDGQPDSQPGVQPDVQPDGQPDAEPSAQPITLPTSPMSPEGPLEPGAATATCTTVLTSPLDHILIFGHGRFQRVVLLCATLAFFSTITHGLANAGLARPVGHWCRLPPEYSDIPKTTWKNTSIPLEADGKTRSECLRYEPPYTLSDTNGVENRTAIPCDAGWEYDEVVDTDFGAYSVINEWDLVCERSWIMTLLTASYMSGGILGAATAGIAADNIGRRPVLRISLFVLVLSGVSLAFSGSLMMFATLRAFISAASASVVVTE
ncbi:hypothetical protein HPB50_029146 [Hyalomma asiaticum]|nr:hypothetical protein HPB50_029146 [Hyalomma asiaticum]